MNIYAIVNTINGKTYIGQTTRHVEERRKKHFQPKSKACPAIASAIKKYGSSAFEFWVLASASSVEELNSLEQSLIAEIGTVVPAGYNLETGGRNGGKDSPETIEKRKKSLADPTVKAKMAESSQRRWRDPEYRARLCEARKRMWQDPSYRENRLAVLRSPENRKRQAEVGRISGKAGGRPVIGVCKKTGAEIRFPSATSATAQGFSQSEISMCTRHPFGKYSHHGYYWKLV